MEYDLNNLPEVECRTNCRVKLYADGSKNYMVCNNAIFKDPFYEDSQKFDKKENIHNKNLRELNKIKDALQVENLKYIDSSTISEVREALNSDRIVTEKDNKDVRYDSMKRAIDTIFDYVMSNDWDFFFTGTFDPELIDSFDSDKLLFPVKKWLDNMVMRYRISYIFVPEYHPSSGRIHFHGLIKESPKRALKMVDSGTKLYKGYNKPVSNEKAEKLGLIDGRTVYNLSTWRFGYSTAIRLTGDRLNTAFYVTKYITKDCKKIFGRFFWHSRDLKKPMITYENIDFDSFDALDYGGFKYRLDRSDNIDSN